MSFSYDVKLGNETYRVDSEEELSEYQAYQEVLKNNQQEKTAPQARPAMEATYGEKISQIASNVGSVYAQTPQRISEAVSSVMDKPSMFTGQPQGLKGFSDPSMLLRAGAEGLVPLVTEPISSAIKVGGLTALELIPDSYEKELAETWGTLTSSLKDTPIYSSGLSALNSGLDAYASFKQDFPDAARDIEAVINVAEIYKPANLKSPVNNKQTVFGKWSEEQDLRAAELRALPTKDFLNKLITPKDTASSRLERVDQKVQTQGSLGLNRNVYLNTPEEDEMIAVLFNTPEVKKQNTIIGNYQAVVENIAKKGDLLEKQLDKASFEKINTPELVAQLKGTVKDLKENNPVISGLTGDVAEKIFAEAERIISKLDSGIEVTPKSILRARRELDAWLNKQPRDAFGDTANAYTLATREIRNVLNGAVEKAIAKTDLDGKPIGTNVEFRKLLREQSLLFKVKERLKEKGADAADSAVGRVLQNLRNMAVNLPSTPLGIAATASFGGSFLLSGPVATALASLGTAGTLGFIIKRGTISPKARESISKVLRTIDIGIKKTRNNEMKRSLALDRAFLVEMLKLPLETVDDSSEEENRE